MNDDRSPIDDELLSAVLDGEATPDERALVEASPEALARLAQLRAAVARLAEPVAPLDAGVSARLLARALDETPEAAVDTGPPSPPATTPPAARVRPVGPARHDELVERRHRRRSWAGALAGVAAAVLLVVVGVSLTRGASRDSASDSSGSGASSATANESATADAAAPTAGGSTALAALGALPDTATVLARFAVLEASGADFDHQFDPSLSSPGGDERNQSAADGAAPVPAPGTACAVPPIAVTAGESWAAAASADLPSGPVIVMVDRAGGTAARVLVVDATTCAVLAEGTT